MVHFSSSYSSSVHDDIDLLVSADKLRLLYHQSFPALSVSILIASLLCLMLWGQVPPHILLGWLAVMVLCSLARLWLFIAYFRSRPAGRDLPKWERPYAVTLIVSSLAWGLGAVIIMPADSALHQVVTLYVMIGLAGGAVSTYSSYRYMAIGSMLSVLMPSTLWLLLQGGVLLTSMAITAIVFILASIRATGVLAMALHRSFQLTHELTRAHAASEQQARTDALTGLSNRRALFEQGFQLHSYCERNAAPLSAILLDVDHFKVVNDTYGHAVGDCALQHLARLLQASLRKSDLCGRIGGEEFVILLPDTSLSAACILAEKLRLVIMGSPLQYKQAAYPMTISLGVASNGDGLEALMHRADAALYRAKAEGRNRVICEEKKA